MTILQTRKLSVALLMLTTLLMAMFFATSAIAANYPLEIINIKPANTGSPAIPSTNRIFRAYPGIEYNIRAAVIGGMYPFKYSLSNAPSGMTIDSTTGTISWPNPQANSGTITLSVTDAENSTVNTSWTITVSTGGFKFIDASYTGIKVGSITQPYSTLAELIAGSTSATDITYFRTGTYSLYELNPFGTGDMNIAGKTHTWIGYPGEIATISGSAGAHIRSDVAIYLDNLSLNNFTNYALMLGGAINYHTVRRCVFTNLTSNSSVNNNYGFIYTTGGGGTSFGYYATFQDNDLSYFTGASAIGSLYSMNRLLIEDNYIHDNGGSGLPGFNTGIAPKEWINYLFIRGNKVIMNNYFAFGNNGMNSTLVDSANIDVSFNYFANITPTGSGLACSFNSYGYSPFHTNNFYFYRNTVFGGVAVKRLNSADCTSGGATGPWTFLSNIMVNLNTSFTDKYGTNPAVNYMYFGLEANPNPQSCITDEGNLKGLPSANIIDTNGNLTPSYSTYLGTHGWQVSPNTSTALKAPTGLYIL